MPGQSGNIGSSHYDDMIPKWIEGKYHPLYWDRADVEKNAERVLILKATEKPKSGCPAHKLHAQGGYNPHGHGHAAGYNPHGHGHNPHGHKDH